LGRYGSWIAGAVTQPPDESGDGIQAMSAPAQAVVKDKAAVYFTRKKWGLEWRSHG